MTKIIKRCSRQLRNHKRIKIIDGPIIHPVLLQKKKQVNFKKKRTQEVIEELSSTIEEMDFNSSTGDQSLSQLVAGEVRKKLQTMKVSDNKIDSNRISNWAYKIAKVCEDCNKWENQKKLIFCEICDDAYHMYCLRPKKLNKKQEWTCQRCLTQLKLDDTKRASKITNHFVTLNKCIKDGVNCSRCKQIFQQSQLDKKSVCQFCQNIKKPTEKENTLIENYFKSSAPISKREFNFILPQPASDVQARQKCKLSLFNALSNQQIEFCDDLQYDVVKREQNSTNLEPLIQKMSKGNLRVFSQFKQLSCKGNYAPVQVVYDKIQGYVVQAIEDIGAMTLICEYAGQVYTYRDQMFTKSDAMMTLLKTSRAQTSLVIIPDRFGNLARYLSGINNYKNERYWLMCLNIFRFRKQNVCSIRFDVDGEARVILYAYRNIKAGELLYYDYNEGGDNAYDTKQFN